jgi:hypothetical protein
MTQVDTAGVFELEPVAGAGRPWVYVWAPGPA